MLKLVLLFLTVSGLHAVPIAVPQGLQRTSSTDQLPDAIQSGVDQADIGGPSFRPGVELSRRLLDRVQDHIDVIRPSLGNGHGEMDRRHWLADEIPVDVPVLKSGGSWVRVEELSGHHFTDGFRQGTEPVRSIPNGFKQGIEPAMPIPDAFRQEREQSFHMPESLMQVTEPSRHIPAGFRQGTEPRHKIPADFRQGTEPFLSIPDGFRQGTEPSMSIPDGFRQGTEPFMSIPDGFRQGTEPFMSIPDGFRQGTEPFMSIPHGFRQGTEPSTFSIQPQTVACMGEVINGNCYEFNPTPRTFQDAQALCRVTGPNAELASVSSSDLHNRLVSLVTKGGESKPMLTWLGGVIKNQRASWVDGSEWSYSDWKPDHLHSDKPMCLEMFHNDESWWTAADCDLKRASLCSYPVSA